MSLFISDNSTQKFTVSGINVAHPNFLITSGIMEYLISSFNYFLRKTLFFGTVLDLQKNLDSGTPVTEYVC